MNKTYRINEVFVSIQGEGVRAGTVNVFIRFAGCNMRCDVDPGPKSPGGFSCDTEFESGRTLTLDQLAEWVVTAYGQRSDGAKWRDWAEPWFILTGGEPGLQVDEEFLAYWRPRGVRFAIETNGSINLDNLKLDWVTVSPKVAEHSIRQRRADEVRYVRGYGQAIPKTVVEAKHKIISPAFDGMDLDGQTLKWCIDLVMANPEWRLSVQTHKAWRVR